MVDILESKVVGTNKETWYKLVGTSEDTKPIGEFPAGTGHTVAKGSTFFEIGTQIKYEFDGSAWAPKGQVDIKLIEKTILTNGTYNASDDDADGYSSVTVDIPEPENENNAKVTTGDGSFRLTDNIESVSIPYGYTEVANSAIIGGGQTSPQFKYVEIPSTVTKIRANAFQGCPALEKIVIHKPENSLSGAPWSAPSTTQIIWTG